MKATPTRKSTSGKSQPKPLKIWSKPTAKDVRLGFELTAYVLKR